MAHEILMRYKEKQDSPTWIVNMDGRASNVIRKSLQEDGMPEDSIIQTMNNAAEVLGYCPNPHTRTKCQKTGIVIGKVQSGKTSNFISLSALAFDNGYNVVVVFGGTKKILVNQNKSRIEQYFRDMADSEVAILDTNNNKELLNSKKIEQFVEMGRKVLIVALKTPAQINKISENVFKNSYLADEPVLVIDDEGDEASLNGLVNKNKKTATYEAIEALKSKLSVHCFVSVTATPQANILIDAIDILSPDFGVLVNPGEGYCGLDVFHSDRKYIRTVNDDDNLQGPGVPETFLDALSSFFVACAIQKNRSGEKNTKMSMLVHESQLKEIHDQEYKKVMGKIDSWRTIAQNKKDISYIDLKSRLLKAYNNYKTEGVKDIPSFDIIEDDILCAIRSCNAHKYNGDSDSNGDDKFYNYNIYIGGSLLGRGLTIKNLVITYITRTPKGKATVDTSEQRARWFGYKTKILDLCRIYMVKKLEGEFKDIRDHEEDLWETVRNAHVQGTNFKDIKRIFTLSGSLKMTRQSVAKTQGFAFSYWNKQRIFLRDTDDIQHNQSLIDKVKDDYADKLIEKRFGKGAPYNILHTDYRTGRKLLLENFTFPTKETRLNGQLIKVLTMGLEKRHLNPRMDIIWMRDEPGQTSDHDLLENDRITNYSVGRRPKETNKPQVYAGDDKQFCEDGTIQVQIHNIKDKASGIVSPTLAMYIPQDIVAQLNDLVCRA